MLTASDSMLKPRRANRPVTRASTPGRFSTRAVMVCCMFCSAPSLLVQDQVLVGLAGGDHREDVFFARDAVVDHHGHVARLLREAERLPHLVRVVHPQAR